MSVRFRSSDSVISELYNEIPKLIPGEEICQFKIKKIEFTTAIKQVKQKQSLTNEGDDKNSSLISRVEAFISKNYDIYFNEVANRFMCRENGNSEFIELNILFTKSNKIIRTSKNLKVNIF